MAKAMTLKKSAAALVLGAAIASGGAGVAMAGTHVDWIGTTDGNSRVHGQVDAWGGSSIRLRGSCFFGGYIYTDWTSGDNRYLKTPGTCWYGVGGYLAQSSG